MKNARQVFFLCLFVYCQMIFSWNLPKSKFWGIFPLLGSVKCQALQHNYAISSKLFKDWHWVLLVACWYCHHQLNYLFRFLFSIIGHVLCTNYVVTFDTWHFSLSNGQVKISQELFCELSLYLAQIFFDIKCLYQQKMRVACWYFFFTRVSTFGVPPFGIWSYVSLSCSCSLCHLVVHSVE